MIHLRDWILSNFLLELGPESPIDFVYFKCSSIIPPAIYKISTDIPWEFVKQLILRFAQPSKTVETEINNDVILTIQQLLNLELWKKLYYIVGKYFFLFFFLECTIFFKWGLNTFIVLFDLKHNLKQNISRPPNYNDKVVPLLLEGTGFDANTPLKMHKMMYNLHFMKKSGTLIPKISLQQLKLFVLSQSVNQELPGENIFTKKKMKLFKKILLSNPTLKECESILLSTVPDKNIISVHYVSIFVTKVMKKYVPNNIFEYKNFFNKYLKNIQQLLKFNLNQKVTLGFLMKGILAKGDLWQKNIASKMALWLLNVFVLKLIRQFFYVTEVAKGSSLVFIRKRFWLRYQNEALEDMIVTRKLIRVEDLQDKSLLKELRFLPKANGSGYRPLIRKSTFDKENETKLEICNTFLKQLIATKYGKYPKHCNDLHMAWIHFTKMRKRNTPFYYVKTDIMDAYGSIIHEKLKALINSLCKSLPECLKLVSFGFKGKWGRMEMMSHFINLQPVIGNKMVTYKGGSLEVFLLTDIKRIIFQYIENIFVSQQRNKTCYRLISGLHQGGTLSAALCELYYSALDDKYLSSLKTHDGDFLLRAVDDYILISQSKEKINRFLEMMLNGFPEYGVRVQIEKTISNLKSDLLKEENISSTPTVQFFGFILDVEMGVITPNMTKYERINLRSCIAFKSLHERILEQKMSSAMSLKLQKLILDSTYQPKKVLYSNIHTASCFLALKFAVIVHCLHIAEVKLNEAYLKFCIMRGVNAIASHCAKKGKPVIHFDAAKKICLRSFILILGRKYCFNRIVQFLMKKENNVKISSKKTVKLIKTVTKILHPSLRMSTDAT